MDGAIQKPEEYINKSKERLITAVSNSNNNRKTEIKKNLGNKNGKKNNYMDTLSDKLRTLHIQFISYGYKRET